LSYDVCVIGGGPAGFAAVTRAHDLGKRVLLVERDRLGGTGIHNGALSSKTLWEMSKDYATARRTDRGYRARELELSYPLVIAAVRAAEDERELILRRQIHAFSGRGLVMRRGIGRFVGPHELEITDRAGQVERITADHFVIATGSRPRLLPGVTCDGVHVITSDHLEELTDFPEELVILGAGVVGCEYATMFARFGRTRVHLLDRETRILPFEDEDVSSMVTESFRDMGMSVHHRTRLDRVEVHGNRVACHLVTPEGPRTISASHLLLSIGRIPNTDGIGLELAGVERAPNGSIPVEDTVTNVPHIYAAGDISEDVAVVNVAELERMFGVDTEPLRYAALSSILFLAPEVAAVGLNEQQARKAGIPYRVAVLDNRMVARNVAMRSTRGFVKLLAAPDGRLLGLRVVGPQASSTVQGVALLIDRGGTVHDLEKCFHAHPAIPEGVQECARLLLGRSIYKPEVHGTSLLRVGEG
jgi:dihydrolipoamide dehydrogenase